jgi:pilus retraction protein PilT
MQRFKSFLNLALSKQALCVRFIADGQPKLVLANHAVEGDGGGSMTAEDIQRIMAAIMPGQSFTNQSSEMVGLLNVGAPGILKLRASCDGILRLDLYMPGSGQMFESNALDKMVPTPPPQIQIPLSAAPAVPAPSIFSPPTPTSPPSISASSMTEPPVPMAKPAQSISIPELSSLVIPPPPAPMAAIPVSAPSAPRQSISIPGLTEMVVPPPPVSAPRPHNAPAVMAMPVPAAVSIPEPILKASEEPEDEQMFRSAATRHKASKPQSTASETIPTFSAATLAMVAPVVIPATEGETAEINFGNDSAAEGRNSNGQNPIDVLLKEMVQLKASDMHLTVGQPVILRIHGDISRISADPVTAEMMSSFLLPTFPQKNHKEFAQSQDTDYAYELTGVGRFRVNVFRDRNGVGAVMRHIPAQILTAEQLGLSAAITKLCHLSKGLVLVTGPTGSGKSTTLAAMLDLINKTRKEHILTVEDPIEFVHPQQMCLVNQREVRKHTGSFGRALKAALREDPDVVLIGELRDLETIAIAIETAETGHLVFGTLHTNTAMSTVDRMIDQFPADRQSQIRTMLASSLKGVVAQTLLKKKGGGRVAAHEILIANDAVSSLIREGKIQHLANHMLTQKNDGNQLLNDALLKLVQDGVVDFQEALFKSIDKQSFVIAAKQKGLVTAA